MLNGWGHLESAKDFNSWTVRGTNWLLIVITDERYRLGSQIDDYV